MRPSTVARTPTAVRPKVRGRRDVEVLVGCGHDGPGERVLAVGLGRRGQGQQLVLAPGAGGGDAGEAG